MHLVGHNTGHEVKKKLDVRAQRECGTDHFFW